MGGLTGGGGGGGSSAPANTTTTQKSEPWVVQQPYLETGLKYAQALFANQAPPSYYGGNTVAPLSAETNAAQQLAAVRALAGSPLQTGANQYAAATLAGQFLPGQAYFDPSLGGTLSQNFNDVYRDPTQSQWFNNTYQAAANKIIPQIQSRFAMSGNSDSSAARQSLTEALGNAFSGLVSDDRNLQAQQFAQRQTLGASGYQNSLNNYYNQQSQERQLQQQAAFAAPQLAAQDYNDYAQLAQIGGNREQLAQNILNEQLNRYNYNSNATQQQLSNFLQAVSGNFGSQGTATQNTSGGGTRSNPIISGLGGALGGYSLASALGGGAAGAGAGAAAGAGAGAGAAAAGFAINPFLGAAIGGGLGILGGL